MTEIKPKIIVIFPVYNGGRTLLEALTCIANQTFSDFKAVIVENHSTDDSLAIAQEFASKDKRFSVVQNEQHLEALETFTRAIHTYQNEADYLVLRAHDDFSALNFLEKNVEVLDSNPTKDLSVCDVNIWIDGVLDHKFQREPKFFTFQKLLKENKAPRRLAFTSTWFYGVYRCGPGTEILLRRMQLLDAPWCMASVVVAEFVFKESIVYAADTYIDKMGISGPNQYTNIGLLERFKRRRAYFTAIWELRHILGLLTLRQKLKIWEIAWRDAKKKTGYAIFGL